MARRNVLEPIELDLGSKGGSKGARHGQTSKNGISNDGHLMSENVEHITVGKKKRLHSLQHCDRPGFHIKICRTFHLALTAHIVSRLSRWLCILGVCGEAAGTSYLPGKKTHGPMDQRELQEFAWRIWIPSWLGATWWSTHTWSYLGIKNLSSRYQLLVLGICRRTIKSQLWVN